MKINYKNQEESEELRKTTLFIKYIDLVNEQKYIYLNKIERDFDITHEVNILSNEINSLVFRKCQAQIKNLNQMLSSKITNENVLSFSRYLDSSFNIPTKNYFDFMKCKEGIVEKGNIPYNKYKNNQKIAFKLSKNCLNSCEILIKEKDLSKNSNNINNPLIEDCLNKCVKIYYDSMHEVYENYSLDLSYTYNKMKQYH